MLPVVEISQSEELMATVSPPSPKVKLPSKVVPLLTVRVSRVANHVAVRVWVVSSLAPKYVTPPTEPGEVLLAVGAIYTKPDPDGPWEPCGPCGPVSPLYPFSPL